jgi:hypothetical protein
VALGTIAHARSVCTCPFTRNTFWTTGPIFMEHGYEQHKPITAGVSTSLTFNFSIENNTRGPGQRSRYRLATYCTVLGSSSWGDEWLFSSAHRSRPALSSALPPRRWEPGLFPGLTRPGRSVDDLFPPRVEIEERVELRVYPYCPCAFMGRHTVNFKSKVKVKITLWQATKAQSGSRCIALLFLQPRRQMRVGGQRHAPAALPLGKTRYPLYCRPVGTQGWSGRVRKISPRPGFDPRTVQPVTSRYTDCVIPAPIWRRLL